MTRHNFKTMAQKYPSDVIDPFEEDFSNLQKQFNFIIKNLKKNKSKRKARRHIAADFNYSKLPIEELEHGATTKQALNTALEAFDGLLIPNHPGTLFNIAPQPLLGTVMLSMFTHLYNPNGLLDIASGKFIYLEKRVIRYIANLIGWNINQAGGFFTFGGKATLMYAIKTGLNAAANCVIEQGTLGSFSVICSENNHYCIENICNFLGIGTSNCHRITSDRQGFMDLKHLRSMITQILDKQQRLAAVVINCGSTINMVVDPIKTIKNMLKGYEQEYHLDYKIHLHCDTVITWPWVFLKDCDIENLAIPEVIKHKISNLLVNLNDIALADSIGLDFHKTGLCPYISSCYVTKSKSKIINMHDSSTRHEESIKFNDQCYFNVTFENSRPCNGIISAFYVLQRFGKKGFINYLLYLYGVCEFFKEVIQNYYQTHFEVINQNTNGYEVVIYIKFDERFKNYHYLQSANQDLIKDYETYCQRFIDFLFNDTWANSHDIPFISYVPGYRNYGGNVPLTGFLIYPASLHIDYDAVKKMMCNLRKALDYFLKQDAIDKKRKCSRSKLPR